MAINFTKESFEKDVLNGTGVVVVDFWAEWCGPCKMLGPVIEDIAKEMHGTALVGKVNVDEQQELAQKYEVMSIPTVLIFKDGKLVNKSVGLVQKAKLLGMINESIAK